MSNDVWLIVDPYQDYEEDMIILGAYANRDEAYEALPAVAAARIEYGRNGSYRDNRLFEIQHWRGTEHVMTFEFAESDYDFGVEPGRWFCLHCRHKDVHHEIGFTQRRCLVQGPRCDCVQPLENDEFYSYAHRYIPIVLDPRRAAHFAAQGRPVIAS